MGKGDITYNGDIKGVVFGIQHFSIHDGTGIRSNVFLKGCRLRCLWCHNPEGLRREPELQYYEGKCAGCGGCGYIYRHRGLWKTLTMEEKEAVTKKCPYHALEVSGKYMTVSEVLENVSRDRKYFNTSGGGITLSGGEPMCQPVFALELLKGAKKMGLGTAMETSGSAPGGDYEKMFPFLDELLWDYKETDPVRHKQYTGTDNEQILENLKLADAAGIPVTIRCPIIPGLNDREEHFKGIADISKGLKNLKGVELMPYHSMGVAKGKRLAGGRRCEYRVPDTEEIQRWKDTVRKFGGQVI